MRCKKKYGFRNCANVRKFWKTTSHCVLFEFVTSFLIDRRQNFSSGWVNKKKVWFLKWTMTFAFISDKNHQHQHPIIHTLCSTMSKSPTFCWKEKCSKICFIYIMYYCRNFWSDFILYLVIKSLTLLRYISFKVIFIYRRYRILKVDLYYGGEWIG